LFSHKDNAKAEIKESRLLVLFRLVNLRIHYGQPSVLALGPEISCLAPPLFTFHLPPINSIKNVKYKQAAAVDMVIEIAWRGKQTDQLSSDRANILSIKAHTEIYLFFHVLIG